MTTEYTRETRVTREKALTILASVDNLEAFCEGQDYWLCETEDGEEHLVGYGEDEPVAENHSSTSWSSPGYPAYLDD